MTDPFRNQRFTSQLSPIRQEPDQIPAPISPQPSTRANSLYNARSYSTEPDLLNRNSMSIGQFRSAANLNHPPHLTQDQQASADASRPPIYYQQINSLHTNKELVKQLRSNIELLFKGTKIFGHFVLYPMKALRWQCQINSESSKFHITPFTLMQVFYNLNYHGYLTLCKGCFSMAAFNGIKIVLESVIGEVASFEKNFEDVNKPNQLYGHLALKIISSAITTPIFSAVIFESVQSGLVNENIGIFDLLREAWNRVTGYKYNYRTRLIPFWSLILPTSLYFVSHHFLTAGLNSFFRKAIGICREIFQEKRKFYKVDEAEREIVEEPYLAALSEFLSQFTSLIILYPIETVLNRLIVQGTRTIIDNTDSGCGVIPINTRYDGFFDCVQSINQTEGVFGFYKGLGALVVESVLFYGMLRLAKTISTRIYDAEWTTRSDNSNFKNLMSTTTTEIPQMQYPSIDLLKKN